MRRMILGKSKGLPINYNSIVLGTQYTPYAYLIDKTTKQNVISFNYYVRAIAEDDNNIYLGGAFSGYFKVIRKSDKAELTGYPTFNTQLRTIAEDNDNIYLGGGFTGRFKVIRKSDKAEITGYPTLSVFDAVLAIAVRRLD